MLGEGGEVVTRQPYRKVWLDHLLSKVQTPVQAGNCLYAEKNGDSPLPAI